MLYLCETEGDILNRKLVRNGNSRINTTATRRKTKPQCAFQLSKKKLAFRAKLGSIGLLMYTAYLRMLPHYILLKYNKSPAKWSK